MATFARNRNTNVSIADRVRLKISISADALPGQRELRLVTPNGVTNPIFFFVGRLPEWSKSPASFLTPDEISALSVPGALKKQYKEPPAAAPPPPIVDVAQPVLVNGQVAQGGVDRYRFAARKWKSWPCPLFPSSTS